MVFLIRGLVFAVLLVAAALFVTTVKIGDRTTVQHVKRIWQSDEAQEMVQDVKREAAPVVERVKRGVTAGAKAAAESDAAKEVADKARREVAEKVEQVTTPIDAGPTEVTPAAPPPAAKKARDRAREAARKVKAKAPPPAE